MGGALKLQLAGDPGRDVREPHADAERGHRHVTPHLLRLRLRRAQRTRVHAWQCVELLVKKTYFNR